MAFTEVALDGITVKLEDGVTVSAEEITVDAVIAEESVTVFAPAVVDKPTIQLPTCVALTEKALDGVTVATDDSATVLLVSVT